MAKISTLLLLTFFSDVLLAKVRPERTVLLVHGGLGIEKKDLTPELEQQYRAGLEAALTSGFAQWQLGKPGLDCVQEAVKVLEDHPLFNAGKGAVFTRDGKNELDASLMEGKGKQAGAVAGVTTVKNPILAARAVMEQTPHVFLIGEGADLFAKQAGLEIVANSYFKTEKRWQEHLDRLELEKKKRSARSRPLSWGTVGAVVLDKQGNLAAGTSTGGMSGKQFGRVGDSPVIGAGTYADNEGVAVSATGHGEFFIRYAVAHEIDALVKHKGWTPGRAADHVINKVLKKAGGEGAVLVLNRKGEAAMAFNSEGFYRAAITESGKKEILLY